MKKHTYFLLFPLGLLIGVMGTLLWPEPTDTDAKQVRRGGYALINPLLECELNDHQSQAGELTALEYELEELIEGLKEQGAVEDVSLYFRDLNNGPTFGVNEKEEFAPASLLKLPIMMAYYQQAEENTAFLNQQTVVPVEEDMNEWESYKSPHFVTMGKSYTHAELIRAMIVSSDNNAMGTLIMGLPLNLQNQVYKDLGLHVPGVKDVKDFMTVADFSSFLRILYNASYLSEEYSERALQLLTEVEFKDGLVLGVPENVKVAHKFGERTFDDKKQLHDCGIVYLTNRPYLLCVMTRGDDFGKLSDSLRQISKHVYDDLSSE